MPLIASVLGQERADFIIAFCMQIHDSFQQIKKVALDEGLEFASETTLRLICHGDSPAGREFRKQFDMIDKVAHLLETYLPQGYYFDFIDEYRLRMGPVIIPSHVVPLLADPEFFPPETSASFILRPAMADFLMPAMGGWYNEEPPHSTGMQPIPAGDPSTGQQQRRGRKGRTP
jgi:hypothetical protein